MKTMGTHDADGQYTLSIDEHNIVSDFACYLVNAEDDVRAEMLRTFYNKLVKECRGSGCDFGEIADEIVTTITAHWQ